jgi:hypothetical protein
VREEGKEVILWRDYTKDERLKMGEILDARYTIAKTFMLMARDLSTGRFFRRVADNEEWSMKDEPPAATWKDASEYNRFWADPNVQWVKVPDTTIPKSRTKRFGALAGMYVRADIWRDIAEMEALSKPNLWDAIVRQWKINKTARSPVTHMNNIMSNVMLMDMADVGAGDLVQAIRAIQRGDLYYKEARDHGAFGSDMVAQEVRENVLKPILAEIEADMRADADAATGRVRVMGRLATGLWNAIQKMDRKMLDLYQMEDEVFRMAVYLRRRRQGASPDHAALEARDQFVNYDIRAPWVNALRRSVLPFISYTYRAVPMIAKTVAVRPWKIGKYALVAYTANALAYALAPSDDDEEQERASMNARDQGYTWVGLPKMMRMPWLDENNNPVFLDVRRWVPAGDIFDTGQGVTTDIPPWLQFGGPLQLAFELMMNRSAFTGRDIMNPLTDTFGERMGKRADYLWKAWMPSAAWVPGSHYNERLMNSLSGGLDAQGVPYSVGQSVLSSVGLKARSQDIDVNLMYRAREFDRVKADLRFEMRRLADQLDRNLISQRDFKRGMEKIEEKFMRLNERMEATFLD